MLERTLYTDCDRLAVVDPLEIAVGVNEAADNIRQYVDLLKEYVTGMLSEDSKIEASSASEISQSRMNVPVSVTGRNRETLTLTYPENQAPLFRSIKQLYKIFRRLANIGNVHSEIPEDATLEDTFTSHDSQFSVFTTPDNTYVRFARNSEDARTYKLYMRILEIDCNPFISTDPFRLELKEDIKKLFVSDITDILRSQYASLLGEYATGAILAEEPNSERSTMAGSRSGSHLIRSPNLWAMSYSDKQIKQLTLEYSEKKTPLVRRLHRLYDVFASLAASSYVPAELPEGARLADVFTSHHSHFFIFDTPDNATYVQFTKDDKTVSYQLTS